MGEKQADRIGRALGLEKEALLHFVLLGMDTCTEKVLKNCMPYPAILFNHLPLMINNLIAPDDIIEWSVCNKTNAIILKLKNGIEARLNAALQM